MQIRNRPEFKSKSAVLTFGPDDLVLSAIKVMSERNFGAVIVVSPDGKPIGIATERDFMRRILNEGRDPTQTKLRDVMTTDLKVAKADDDLLDWLRQMSNERFRHLPIVDDGGKVISIMSQGDFVSYTWPQLVGRVTEHARATFDLNPSIFSMFAGIVILMLAVILIFVAIG